MLDFQNGRDKNAPTKFLSLGNKVWGPVNEPNHNHNTMQSDNKAYLQAMSWSVRLTDTCPHAWVGVLTCSYSQNFPSAKRSHSAMVGTQWNVRYINNIMIFFEQPRASSNVQGIDHTETNTSTVLQHFFFAICIRKLTAWFQGWAAAITLAIKPCSYVMKMFGAKHRTQAEY